ncbi:MAG: putative RDD family membrane protein YckC [Verrucomicrobiales bacterium]
MQIYLLQDGEKCGPFTVFEVAEEVRSDRATEDTLGWYKDAEGWIALGELPATSSIFVEPPPREEVEEADDLRARMAPERMRSSVRLWARLIDLFLLQWVVSVVILATGWMDATELLTRPHLGVQLLPAALLVLLEAFTISALGTTPGKWLLRIRVHADAGGKIPLSISFYRALTVWWRGVGLWIVPLNILMMALAQASLLRTGKTPWDRACGLHLTYGKVDKNRIFLLVGIFILMLTVMVFAFNEQMVEAVEAQRQQD